MQAKVATPRLQLCLAFFVQYDTQRESHSLRRIKYARLRRLPTLWILGWLLSATREVQNLSRVRDFARDLQPLQTSHGTFRMFEIA